jgi:hypothetical protein
VNQAQRLHAPSVFVSGGKTWALKPDQYDMSVIFPPQEGSADRPEWLRLGGLRIPYGVGGEVCNSHYPCMVEARYADEGPDAIPADRVILNLIDENAPSNAYVSFHGGTSGRLFLRPGKYKFSAMDRQGHNLFGREVDIVAGAPKQ